LAGLRLAHFFGTSEARYPAIVRLWENALPEFVPLLAPGREIRTLITTTNAMERLNARSRGSVKARGHFPDRAGDAQAFLPGYHQSRPLPGRGTAAVEQPLEAALKAFDITFDGRLSAGRK
jgi:putative transposase